MSSRIGQFSFLVVEDHPFQRRTLEQILRAQGATEIQSAATGVEAIRLLRKGHRVDIVISDLMMPDMDGIELISELQSNAPGVAIVFLSSEQTMLDIAFTMAQAQGLRALGTLGKPVSTDRLRAILESY